MKKLLSLIISTLLFFNTAYSAQTRTVEKSNIDEAWKVDGKFIKAECFDYIWVSGDRYETFFDKYFKKPEGSHWDEPKFLKFTDEVGMYLNKEVPLNHFVNTGWESDPEISLTKQLEGCLSEKPETFVRFTDGTSNTIGYKVVHNFDPYFAKELAPYIDQKFESVKQVEIEEWGGGSMGPQTHMVVFGVLELEGKKVLLPLRNKSILTEIGKRDSFFEGNGRYSYEAEFDLNDDITKIININDFKQMVSSDGCFKINDFATDGKIYDFLNKNKLKTYCNKVRPFDDINWFLKQREFKDSQDLIFDDKEYRFSNLIRSQVPDIQVPWSDYPRRLGEELIESIWFNGDIQYLNNGEQVVVSGCVYKFCSQKGFIFAYKDNFIGLIQHGTEEWDVDDFLVFSKKHKNFTDLPDSFFVAVKDWTNKTNSSYGFDVIKPVTVRFLGSDNKINEVENLFVSINCIEGDCINGTGTFEYKDGSKYAGEWKDGKINGEGTKTNKDGQKYVGEWKDNKPNGQGTFTWPDGKKYIGEFKDDKFNGQGTLTTPVGSKYVGEFKDGKRNGQGIFTASDGSKYVGEFKDGKRNGLGTKTNKDGSEYAEEWKDGKRIKRTKISNNSNINCIAGNCVNGTGAFKYKDGSKYTGKFKNGKRHGQGSLEMSNGTIYTGLSKADVFSGEGTILYSTGDKYVGEIQNNKRNGQGAYTFANGLTSIGEWKDNKTVGSHTIADPEKVGQKAVEKIIEEEGTVFISVSKTYEDGSKYVGTLNAINQKKHGKGKFTRPDGFEYEGEFKDDLFHGKGISVMSDGTKYSGEFKNDINDGKGTLTFPDGGEYVGGFKNGELSGKGYLIYADGSYHEGEYLNNKKHGHGFEKSANGHTYVGNYKEGRFHGYGVATNADGTQYKGTWEMGELVK